MSRDLQLRNIAYLMHQPDTTAELRRRLLECWLELWRPGTREQEEPCQNDA